ncbi:hypothetical protein [Dolichospermum circinale]|uniref:hypothetical protein n=1 Tax=Dolichospermum circinale TaxID=109265 RepID=UPI00232EFC4E|nr:hypothetical protein [Dolichospermum circinale]MDB9546850.1 hypothetical protein [Dolichospermum circinale CS-1031]
MIGEKTIQEYLFLNETEGHLKHEDYIACPASAFLKFCMNAKDSIEYCKNKFSYPDPQSPEAYKKLTKESHVMIQIFLNSILASLMGHFETYQKYLFAGVFERSVYLEIFDTDKFFRTVDSRYKDNDGVVQIGSNHLLAYRGEDSASTGVILADTLKGWHKPKEVNKYMAEAFGFKTSFYSCEDIKDLQCLWQLRHSIVHTAGTITKPDALKVTELSNFSGKNIVLTNKFIYELSKRMHSLVKGSNNRLQNKFMENIRDDISEFEKENIIAFFKVDSSNPKWLL